MEICDRVIKNGQEYCRCRFTYEGKRYETYGKDEESALKKKIILQDKLKNGIAVKQNSKGKAITGDMKVSEWAEEWLKIYIQPRVREVGEDKQKGTMTQKSYKVHYDEVVHLHIVPAIGKTKLCKVTDAQLQKFVNTQAGTSEAHVKRIIQVLNGMFSQAVRSRLIVFNPADGLTLPRVTSSTRRSLTDYERKILLQVAETNKYGLWIKFLLATGVRPGESAPLRKYDFDMKAAVPVVKIYKAIESGSYHVETMPKTKAGERIIPLPSWIAKDIEELIKDKNPEDYVFTQSDGVRPMSSTIIEKSWKVFRREMDIAMGAKICKRNHIPNGDEFDKNGIPLYPDVDGRPMNGHAIADDLVLYCLRHTFCTDLQKAGVPINQAKYLMGHSDISVTANIYTHSGIEDAITAGEIINASKIVSLNGGNAKKGVGEAIGGKVSEG